MSDGNDGLFRVIFFGRKTCKVKSKDKCKDSVGDVKLSALVSLHLPTRDLKSTLSTSDWKLDLPFS